MYNWKKMDDEIMAERLLGKIAIITGASSGMGRATARALLDEGATVIMLCRNEKR